MASMKLKTTTGHEQEETQGPAYVIRKRVLFVLDFLLFKSAAYMLFRFPLPNTVLNCEHWQSASL